VIEVIAKTYPEDALVSQLGADSDLFKQTFS
jgi:hypothetical protein